ncbi:MAG: RNA polymerase sigma factor [Lachnospiraceae bacterium]|nr:RNA polymerase sigma factor [Lachnospiraceae bacterium]
MQVYSYVMTLAGKKHIAEEITQETFYKAFTAKSPFRGESNALTWLCAIARNLFVDEMRRQSKSVAVVSPDTDADSGVNIECEVEDKDTSYQIHQVLNELEEPYRQVFELRIFGEMSFREISSICGKTESWARVTYHRAKLKIMERMDIHETEL